MGGATWPQRLRSAALNAALKSSALQRPAPTSTSEPTIERTWRCRNDRALASNRISSPSRLTSSRSSVRIGEFAWHCESRKVEKSCLPDERARRRAHRLGVEARLHPPGRAALEGEGRAAIDDAIEIVASFRAVARVEIGAHALDADNRHRMGMDERIEPLAQAERVPVALKVDMRDLAQRMHASVRAPRAMSGYARAGHRSEGALQNFLDREAVLLPLPADERRPVIFEREFIARHAPPGPARRGEPPRWLRRGLHRRAGRCSGKR